VKTDTTKRRARLKKVREATRTLENCLLELKKDAEGVVFIPPPNEWFEALYYIQRLAKEAA
jgi:hypothetical protein